MPVVVENQMTEWSKHKVFLLNALCHGFRHLEEGRADASGDSSSEKNAKILSESKRLHDWFEIKGQESVVFNGIYWILAGLMLMSPLRLEESGSSSKSNILVEDVEGEKHSLFQIPKEIEVWVNLLIEVIQSGFVKWCGGYRSHVHGTDSITATLSAIQIFCLLNRKDLINRSATQKYICSLQDPNSGAFRQSIEGKWIAESDLKFSLCALVILHHMDIDLSWSSIIWVDSSETQQQHEPSLCEEERLQRKKLVQYILECQNKDGGFGSSPGNESHAGHTYCAVACLSLLDELDVLRLEFRLECLHRNLNTRLVLHHDANGPKNPLIGLNGRPGKPTDVCYAWWVLATVSILSQSFPNLMLLLPSVEESVVRNSNKATTSLNIFDMYKKHPEFFIHWIESCQSTQGGGFRRISQQKENKPGFLSILLNDSICSAETTPDPFHTFFAIGALSVLRANTDLLEIDPRTAFPLQH